MVSVIGTLYLPGGLVTIKFENRSQLSVLGDEGVSGCSELLQLASLLSGEVKSKADTE
jgi:hypothetical protein